MLALAFLTVAAAAEHAQPPPAGLIPLTRNEIARLAATLTIQPARDTRYRLRWSRLAPPPPAPRPDLPLPAPSRPRPMNDHDLRLEY